MIKDDENPFKKGFEELFPDTVKIELRIEDPSHLLGRHGLVSLKRLISKDDLENMSLARLRGLIINLNVMIAEMASFYEDEENDAKRAGSQ